MEGAVHVEEVGDDRLAVVLRVLRQVDREVEIQRRPAVGAAAEVRRVARVLVEVGVDAVPCVVVNSAPGRPFVSCQPNGEASASAGFMTTVRGPSFGLSFGTWYTR